MTTLLFNTRVEAITHVSDLLIKSLTDNNFEYAGLNDGNKTYKLLPLGIVLIVKVINDQYEVDMKLLTDQYSDDILDLKNVFFDTTSMQNLQIVLRKNVDTPFLKNGADYETVLSFENDSITSSDGISIVNDDDEKIVVNVPLMDAFLASCKELIATLVIINHFVYTQNSDMFKNTINVLLGMKKVEFIFDYQNNSFVIKYSDEMRKLIITHRNLMKNFARRFGYVIKIIEMNGVEHIGFFAE